jgi:hypothetical protein
MTKDVEGSVTSSGQYGSDRVTAKAVHEIATHNNN